MVGHLRIDREIASYYNADISIDKGIFIADVERNSPAAKADIRKGDNNPYRRARNQHNG